ncbi:MAG: flagellar basal body M-ring protein FliF, partial [Clostridium sp.]|uniref:flagellar M-ring protein FliF C-terminal domain-containing protein n=1 Tax=Clostridium sp. TaxID=1506 RepID=UPI0025C0E8B3
TIDEENNNTGSSKEEVNTNYEIGKTETKTISAPGEVKRLTASVFIDGNIQGNVQTALEQSVANAIGLKTDRGDSISVVGMTFDPANKPDLVDGTEGNGDLALKNRNRIILYSILGVLGLIVIIITLIIVRRRKKNNQENENLLDVVIDDRISNKINEEVQSIDFETVNPKVIIENEIKKYATDKPDQVVDIIKSWLAESER